jgi:hypothetical protein
VTAVFEVPLTVGVNVALWPPVSDALVGDRVRFTVSGGAGGCNITETDAVLVGSATLVAVTVTVCWLAMVDGA